VQARIINVDEVRSIDLADARTLTGGWVEKISPVKVPRLIGKRNSMINMIAQFSGCQLVVGRNGFIFISAGGNPGVALKAIRMVEAQAHTSGLTDRVAALLSAETGKTVQAMPDPAGPMGGRGENTGAGAYRQGERPQ
jgi:exosome complex component RRP4